MEFENLLQSGSSDNDRDKSPRRPKRSQRSGKRKRRTFISPSLIMNAFPDIAPAILCQLTELDPPTPSEVLDLIPAATSEQIARFFDTLTGEPDTSPTPARGQSASQPAEDAASLTEEVKANQESADDTR